MHTSAIFLAKQSPLPVQRCRCGQKHEVMCSHFALQNFGGLVLAHSSKEALVHRHLCSHCAAVITLDEGGKCQSENDHTDGPCEACAFAQPDLEEAHPDANAANEASEPRTLS